MNQDLQKLIQTIEVEQIDKYLFIGNSPSFPPRIFGGQVLAQALSAAGRTVEEDRSAHSMHAYFLRPGNPQKQIVYDVDPIRDGKSFTTRRVVAKQDGVAIFNTSISFQTAEEGLEHQVAMPDVPGPEGLECEMDYMQRMKEKYPEYVKVPTSQAFDRRAVKRRDPINPEPEEEPVQHYWFKANGDLGDDQRRHQAFLAYISDHALLGAALLPHAYTGWSPGIQAASLDHALWFHRPVKADEYLLYTQDSPTAGGSRGFSRGMFFNQQGELVASTAQESLIRVRK